MRAPGLISAIFMQFSAKILPNKNAFQWDAYRPLLWFRRGAYIPGGDGEAPPWTE